MTLDQRNDDILLKKAGNTLFQTDGFCQGVSDGDGDASSALWKDRERGSKIKVGNIDRDE